MPAPDSAAVLDVKPENRKEKRRQKLILQTIYQILHTLSFTTVLLYPPEITALHVMPLALL